MTGLTKAQEGVLHQVAVHGERKYNGRMRKTIEALEAAGLVEVDWDMHLTSKGNGIQPVWCITVRLSDSGM